MKLLSNFRNIKCGWSKAREHAVPSYPIEHVVKTPEPTDEQRASILGDNAAKLLKISLS